MMRYGSLAAEFGAALAAAGLLAAGVVHAAASAPASAPAEPERTLEFRPNAVAGVQAEPFIAPEPSDARPVLAIILDDIGPDRAAAQRALALSAPVTLSILPYAENAPDLALEARTRGHEVFVHMPMEPEGLEDPGPGALYGHLTPDALAARAAWALSRTPGASGFNNHMGSRLTASPAAMRALFASLEGAPLLFVDSLTSPDSIAAREAGRAGLPAMSRDVFLDHERDRAHVDAQLAAAAALAQQRGYALAIGHPRPETFEAIEAFLASDAAASVRIATASEAARVAGRRTLASAG